MLILKAPAKYNKISKATITSKSVLDALKRGKAGLVSPPSIFPFKDRSKYRNMRRRVVQTGGEQSVSNPYAHDNRLITGHVQSGRQTEI